MPEKDFAVSSVGLPQVGKVAMKPCYLVTLLNPAGKKAMHFIALDKPDLLEGFVQVKGYFSDLSEEELVKTYVEVVTSAPLDSRIEMMFPWHRILSIRSLVFNANKPSTLVR
jgi:hypothetical protein